MSERKVLNKYYPADYDPSKIPRAKRPKNRQWTIRTMAPFNMRCNTCGEYIYKGKKFNSRQELAEGETYLGLKIFRFYIKCPKCVAEISFKTDPENVDYALESGATRNFEALRTAERMAEKEAKEKEEELANNPMKMLENRTKASQREMDMLETLEDLKQVNAKHNQVNTEDMILKYRLYEEKLEQLQDEEDEAFIQSVFGKSGDRVVKRIADESDSDDDDVRPKKMSKSSNPTDILTNSTKPSTSSSKRNNADSLVTKSTSATESSIKAPVKNTKSTSVTESSIKVPVKNTLANNVPKKKSIGLLGSSKSSLGILVKKKDLSSSTSTVTSGTSQNKGRNSNTVKSSDITSTLDNGSSSVSSSSNSTEVKDCVQNETKTSATSSEDQVTSKGIGGLGLLGDYTDSEDSSD